ncbi:MAG TPA: TonB-dependent receptor [Gemmatimonadaceae bacterium]|nr:TonB-dependent receptor [Gemmatimonadaceae bacterium]
MFPRLLHVLPENHLVRRAFLAVLGLMFAGGVSSIPAQTPARPPGTRQPLPAGNGEVRGTVLDAASDSGVARASVSVRNKRDSTLVAGAIAVGTGTFRIQGLRPGAYSLRATFIGYAPVLRDFTVSDAAPSVNLGSIKLSRVAVTLQGVAVTEERAAVAIEPDRNAYRAKDIAPAAASASEVLDAVPSVQVDGDGKVSLRGNENVAVQINGRPSPIRGTQLGAYLKGLPANIVERVEVIPNPSAKYDPEGMAGIINIVLKQNVDLGVSGGLNLGVSQSNRYNASGNLGYQSGPLTTFSNLSDIADTRAIVGINDRERFDALNALRSVTNQDIANETGNGGQNFNTNVDYRLGRRDVLSNSLSINRRNGTDQSVSAYTELNASRTLLDRYERPRNNNTKGLMFDYNMALKHTFEPRKHELSAELRFNHSRDEDHTLLWRQPPTAAGASSAARVEGELDDTDALTKQLNAQLDFTRPLGAKMKLETGYKGTARWLDRDFLVQKDSLGTGAWSRSILSNAFGFDETVNAAYGVLSRTAGKFELQGGLRAEYASRDFSLTKPANHYPYNYGSLFPSGVLLYNPSPANQLKFSYSRRIRRPGTQELNPFPSFFDVQNVFVGNPNLSPEYTDAIELGWTRNGSRGTLQLSPFYRRTTDVIRVEINTADVIDGREVTSITFKNLATSNSWGTDVNGTLRFGTRFNTFASFNIFKMVTDGGSTSTVGSDAVTWTSRVNATYTVSPTLTVQASHFYRAPMNFERGTFSAFQMTNFSVRQKLNGDKVVMSLRLNDPFNTGIFRVRVGDKNITQITERNFGARTAFVTFQFTYGQTPQVRQPRQEQPEARPGFP